MEKLIKILIERLAGKGLEISTIPAFIRDLANTMIFSGYSSLEEPNRRLESLAWDDFALDDHPMIRKCTCKCLKEKGTGFCRGKYFLRI